MINYRVKLKTAYIKKLHFDKKERLGTVIRISRNGKKWSVMWDGRKTEQAILITKLEVMSNIADIVNSIFIHKLKQ